MRARSLATGLALAATALAAPARADEPFLVEDPVASEAGEWEIYAPFVEVEGRGGDYEAELGAEINYGVAPGLQLSLSLPVALEHSDEGLTSAPGDIEAGIKWQFIDDDEAGLFAAFFPSATFPTAGKGLGADDVIVELPLLAQKDFGDWSLMAGGSYTINPGAGNRDFWSGGVALYRSLGDDLSIGIEANRVGPDTDESEAMTNLGLGSIIALGGPFSLDLFGGPGISDSGETGFHAYTALGMEF